MVTSALPMKFAIVLLVGDIAVSSSARLKAKPKMHAASGAMCEMTEITGKKLHAYDVSIRMDVGDCSDTACNYFAFRTEHVDAVFEAKAVASKTAAALTCKCRVAEKYAGKLNAPRKPFLQFRMTIGDKCEPATCWEKYSTFLYVVEFREAGSRALTPLSSLDSANHWDFKCVDEDGEVNLPDVGRLQTLMEQPTKEADSLDIESKIQQRKFEHMLDSMGLVTHDSASGLDENDTAILEDVDESAPLSFKVAARLVQAASSFAQPEGTVADVAHKELESTPTHVCIWEGPGSSDVRFEFPFRGDDGENLIDDCDAMKFVSIPVVVEQMFVAKLDDNQCKCSVGTSGVHLFAYLLPDSKQCGPKECWELYTNFMDFKKPPTDVVANPGNYKTSIGSCNEEPCAKLSLSPPTLLVDELRDLKNAVRDKEDEAIQFEMFLDKYKFDFVLGSTSAMEEEDRQNVKESLEVPSSDVPDPGSIGDRCISRQSSSWSIPLIGRHWTSQSSTCGKTVVMDDMVMNTIIPKRSDYGPPKEESLGCYVKESKDGAKPEDGSEGVCALPRRKNCDPRILGTGVSTGGCRLGTSCKKVTHSYQRHGYLQGYYCVDT